MFTTPTIVMAVLLGVLGTQEIIILLVLVAAIIGIVRAVSSKTNGGYDNQPMPSEGSTSSQQTVVVVNEGKSLGLAFLLTFLFGPLGLLYVSVTGGIIMILLSLLIGIITLGYGLIITWMISMIWAISAAGNSKKNTIITNHTATNPTPQVAAPPVDRESLLNQLSQLHSLKEKGVVTEEIYEQERRRVLDQLSRLT